MSNAAVTAAPQTLTPTDRRVLETLADGIQTQWHLQHRLGWDVLTTDERLTRIEQQDLIYTLWIRRQRYIALTAAGITLLRQEGMLP